MIIVGNTLVSLDILEEEFVCNLGKCKGACCVEGEFGAPLNQKEIELINENISEIKPFMTGIGRALIDDKGFYEVDPEMDLVTQCVSGRDCVFAVNEEGTYQCAIEKAYHAGKSSFHKPLSCHLYPIRLSEVGDYVALNYSRWDICSSACRLGKELKMPVYKFLKEPLIRRFGEDWYAELEAIATQYLAEKAK